MQGIDRLINIQIELKQSVNVTPRLIQTAGMFDFTLPDESRSSWHIRFELPEKWNIGLIVGASGSGKTTLAKKIFSDFLVERWEWSEHQSIIDDFPKEMSIKEITELLSSVGFSSPPAWLRPFFALSNGEQFRVFIARTLAERRDIAVVDEFSSIVDRTVAQIGSSAIQKAVRKRDQKFVAISCHFDILSWLEPDWVFNTSTGEFFSGRYLHQRPNIEVKIFRVHHSLWQQFRQHHYLNTDLKRGASCFAAFIHEKPVAFSAWIYFPHPRRSDMKIEHRTVVLPDYQGIGIGNHLSAVIASLWKALGYTSISTTSHPGMIQHRRKSSQWQLTRLGRNSSSGKNSSIKRHATTRFTASFKYIGKAMNIEDAKRLHDGEMINNL